MRVFADEPGASNKIMLSSLPIPIPLRAEQVTICEQVDTGIAGLGALEDFAGKSLLRAGRLRQSILSDCFSNRVDLNDDANK